MVRRLEEEPGPPDEGRAGQDPPRGDWHLKTRVRPNGHVLLTVMVSVPHDGLTCPHCDAGCASGSLGLHLLTGGLKLPLSLQQHLDLKTNRNQMRRGSFQSREVKVRGLNLSLQEAELPVLLEKELVGVCRQDSTYLIAALIHKGGLRKPWGRCRVVRATTPWDRKWKAEGTRRSRVED